MKWPTPLITLVAGVILGGAALGLNTRESSDGAEPAPYAAPSATVPAASDTSAPGGASASAPATASAGASNPASAPKSYAGYATVDGAGVPLAVTVAGGRAIAYFCDGAKLESWLRGTASGPTITLSGKSGANLAGTIAADGVITGKVTVPGGTYPYRLKLAKKPSGLYRATEPTRQAVIGWIVQDGKQTGLATGPSGSTPAPPLDPATLTATVEGAPVTAAPADPTTEP